MIVISVQEVRFRVSGFWGAKTSEQVVSGLPREVLVCFRCLPGLGLRACSRMCSKLEGRLPGFI